MTIDYGLQLHAMQCSFAIDVYARTQLGSFAQVPVVTGRSTTPHIVRHKVCLHWIYISLIYIVHVYNIIVLSPAYFHLPFVMGQKIVCV